MSGGFPIPSCALELHRAGGELGACLWQADHRQRRGLLDAVLAGMGIRLQPHELVRGHLESGQLVEVLLDFPVPVRPFHLLDAPVRRMTPKLCSFIDFAVAAFGVP